MEVEKYFDEGKLEKCLTPGFREILMRENGT
jgi:hypothetical protein